MVDGKALIDLRHLNQCDMDGECVEVCPTDVVTLNVVPEEPVALLTDAEAASLNSSDDATDPMGFANPLDALFNGYPRPNKTPPTASLRLPIVGQEHHG